jgi:crossover junction endodeoxyribonuclease RusA
MTAPTESAVAITLEFSEIPDGPNARLHWGAKAKANKRFREWAEMQTLSARNERQGVTYECIRVSATFVRRAIGTADTDNDIARLKPILDGIVDGGLIPNDRPAHLQLGTITQERGPRSLRILIEPVLA